MDTKKLAEAISGIDAKYIDKALNYRRNTKKKKRILPLAASLVIGLLFCGFTYASYVYWGVGSAGNIGFRKLTQPFGTVADGQRITEHDGGIFFEKSHLISDYGNAYANNSVCVATNNDTIPSIYFSPNYMVIFSREDEQGWTLKADGKLTLNFSLYHAQSLELEIGYVWNGEYHILSTTKGCDFNETLTASHGGEYYFCVTNHSSENAIITTGSITANSLPR